MIALRGTTGKLIQAKTSGTDGARLEWDAVKEVVAGEAFYQRRHPKVKFEKVCLANQLFNSHATENASLNKVELLDQGDLTNLLEKQNVTILEVERMFHTDWNQN